MSLLHDGDNGNKYVIVITKTKTKIFAKTV